MATFLKPYFETEGPFGIPMKDKQAKALEARLQALPKDDAFAFRRCSFERGIAELSPEGRCDVSWITEQSPDRAGDIVVARGMDDSHFQLNPIVTLNHVYDRPPVGRSLWRRRVREGSLVGVKAKTHYPAKPATWSAGDWPPDVAFELVKSGLLCGKSIGFLPLKIRTPTAEEIGADASLRGVRYIIEEWLLAEYACCFLPTQPNAVVEEICKAWPGPLPARLAAADRPSPLTPLPRGARGTPAPTPLPKGERGMPVVIPFAKGARGTSAAMHMAGGSPAAADRPGCLEAEADLPVATLTGIETALWDYLRTAPWASMIEQALERSWQRLRGGV
jgi:hypothetical protein